MSKDKVLIPIKINDIRELSFNHYNFYYKVDSLDYIFCVSYKEFLVKKNHYMVWYIEYPISKLKIDFV